MVDNVPYAGRIIVKFWTVSRVTSGVLRANVASSCGKEGNEKWQLSIRGREIYKRDVYEVKVARLCVVRNQ